MPCGVVVDYTAAAGLATAPQFFAHGVATLRLGLAPQLFLLLAFRLEGLAKGLGCRRLPLQFSFAAQFFRHGIL